MTISFENRYLCKNGEYIVLSWNASSDPDSGNLYCIARNITEEKIAEQNLIDDNNFIKNIIFLLLNNTPEAMQIILESNKNDDIKILKNEIHKLKSSLSILGMIKASNCVDVIELEIEKNPLGQKRKDEVNNLNEICQLALKELELTTEF